MIFFLSFCFTFLLFSLVFTINSGASASAARLSGRLIDSNTIAAETFSAVLFCVSVEDQTTTAIAFANLVAVRIVMSCLIVVAEESGIHLFYRFPDPSVVVFERFDVVSPEIAFDVTAADLPSVAFDFHISTVSEEPLIVSVFFCCSGFVVMDDCFLVTPEVGCSCDRSSGSGQGVEQIF